MDRWALVGGHVLRDDRGPEVVEALIAWAAVG